MMHRPLVGKIHCEYRLKKRLGGATHDPFVLKRCIAILLIFRFPFVLFCLFPFLILILDSPSHRCCSFLSIAVFLSQPSFFHLSPCHSRHASSLMSKARRRQSHRDERNAEGEWQVGGRGRVGKEAMCLCEYHRSQEEGFFYFRQPAGHVHPQGFGNSPIFDQFIRILINF